MSRAASTASRGACSARPGGGGCSTPCSTSSRSSASPSAPGCPGWCRSPRSSTSPTSTTPRTSCAARRPACASSPTASTRNPLVVRIAGYGYQQGFGGHFHNDNGVAVLRDVPGLVIASPAHPADAPAMLRTCVAAAVADGTVSVFLEPIARYHTRDLHGPGDEGWTAPYAAAVGVGARAHPDRRAGDRSRWRRRAHRDVGQRSLPRSASGRTAGGRRHRLPDPRRALAGAAAGRRDRPPRRRRRARAGRRRDAAQRRSRRGDHGRASPRPGSPDRPAASPVPTRSSRSVTPPGWCWSPRTTSSRPPERSVPPDRSSTTCAVTQRSSFLAA